MTEQENCIHDCSACSESCSSRENIPESFLEEPNKMSSIKKVIAVVSGKGGVGKSLVTSMLAVTLNRRGLRTAILDADITGPSIPKAFGLQQKAIGTEFGMLPVKSKTGIDIMSINLLLEDETEPVVWRGPVIAGAVKQFWTEVIWNDVDVLFVDMPPGTGDVPLTVFQSLPVDGIIIVTSPQELVSMIVSKDGQYGSTNGNPHRRHCGKYELPQMPRLRQGNQTLRRKPYRGSGRQIWSERLRKASHGPGGGFSLR